MAKKKQPTHSLTPAQKEELMRSIGLVAALFSKFLLQNSGCEVDFRINGEDISDIEKLHELDITSRLELAVKEERYLDAAKWKKILEMKKPKPPENEK